MGLLDGEAWEKENSVVIKTPSQKLKVGRRFYFKLKEMYLEGISYESCYGVLLEENIILWIDIYNDARFYRLEYFDNLVETGDIILEEDCNEKK